MDFLPEVKMDFIPSDEEVDDDDSADENDVVEEKVEMVIEEEEESIVPVAKSKREDMNVDEIFNMPQKEVKLTKKGKPRKQRPPMSEP